MNNTCYYFYKYILFSIYYFCHPKLLVAFTNKLQKKKRKKKVFRFLLKREGWGLLLSIKEISK